MTQFIPSTSPCPIGRASRILGDRWIILILREAFLGVERFDHFFERLPISRAVLSDRMSWLIDSGLIEKCPPEAKRGLYKLTDKGKALEPTFAAIREWSDSWLFADDEQRNEDFLSE